MNDDLDEEIIGSDDGFDEFAQKSNVGDMVRQSPVMKIGVVVVAVALLVGVVMMFGGNETPDMPSSMPVGPDITATPGDTGKVDPAYTKAVEEQNQADLELAVREGRSAIPVPIETQDTRLDVPEMQEEAEDPLHRWRVLQEERVEREMKTRDAAVEPVTVLDAEQQSEAINALSESMAEQMGAVLSANNEEKKFTSKTFISYESDNAAMAGAGAGSGAPDGAASSAFEDENEEVVVIPAGKVVYGQLLLEANSDIESMVLAQMVSGPLKGWKLLGEFTAEEEIELLSITFNVAVNEDGDQYEISAIMLDPDTTLAAMRSDINHRYIKRIVLPAAAAFIDGFATAIADSGRTTITVSGETVVDEEEEPSKDEEVATGVTEAATEIRTILDDMADVPVQIIIAAGTPIGVFFTENVVDTEGDI